MKQAKGPGTLRLHFHDALYNLTEEIIPAVVQAGTDGIDVVVAICSAAALLRGGTGMDRMYP